MKCISCLLHGLFLSHFCFLISMYTLLAAVTRSPATVQAGARWLQKDLVRSVFKGHPVRSTAALPQQDFPSVDRVPTPSSTNVVTPQKPDEGEPFKPFAKNLFLGQFDKVRLFILLKYQHVFFSFFSQKSLLEYCILNLNLKLIYSLPWSLFVPFFFFFFFFSK